MCDNDTWPNKLKQEVKLDDEMCIRWMWFFTYVNDFIVRLNLIMWTIIVWAKFLHSKIIIIIEIATRQFGDYCKTCIFVCIKFLQISSVG